MDPAGVRLRPLTPVARRGAWVLVAALLGALHAGEPTRARATASSAFDYLYVESNTGGASGGHAALCLDGGCYHFQQIEPGTIRLHRDSYERFDFDYRILGNRNLHATRVAITPDTEARLRAAFERTLLVQDRDFEILDDLQRDRNLIERWLAQQRAPTKDAVLHVAASGYFVGDQDDESTSWWPALEPGSPALATLRDHVRVLYGADVLERRAALLENSIRDLTPPADTAAAPLADDGLAPPPPGFAAQYEQLLSGLIAVEVLRQAPRLNPAAVLRAEGDAFRLNADEIAKLKTYASHLQTSLAALLNSQRSDWGYPLLIGMARLAAIEASIDAGRLVMLDVFAERARSVAPEVVAAHAQTLSLVRKERAADFARLRAAFFEAEELEEARFSMLELASNLWVETDRGLVQHTPIRLPPSRPLPERGALRRDWPVPRLSTAALDGARAAVVAREQRYRSDLARRYPYDLFRRNCVTELFRTMESALADDSEPQPGNDTVRQASASRLGGYVVWRRSLAFIPAMSERAVRNAYTVSEAGSRLSYRNLVLQRMYAQESSTWVALRESNVLTARAYEHNEDDSLFLFFTDDVLLRRPLYGAANLAVAAGGVLAGVVLLPFDHGATVQAALSGALFSIPELAFINIRKGSFAFAPRSWGWEDASPSR